MPTNVVIRLRWEAPPSSGPAEDVGLLRVVDGIPVPVTVERSEFANVNVTSLRMLPSEPLNPLEGYEIVRAGASVGMFVTGSGPDVAPPDPITLLPDVRDIELCDADLDLCCSEARVRRVSFSAQPREHVVVGLDRSDGAPIAELDLIGPELQGLVLEGLPELECKTANRVFTIGGPGRYSLTATTYDLSGNAGAPTELAIDAEFAPEDTGGCGCAAGRTRGNGPGGSALYVLMIVWWWRTRTITSRVGKAQRRPAFHTSYPPIPFGLLDTK